MATYKRKKNCRLRGSQTHGWGAKKKHRGAGNRGGRGNAGSGKRGDARKPYFRVKLGFELGRTGFKNAKQIAVMNISDLENRFDSFLASGLMTKNNETYSLDLSKLSVVKLLGTGNPKHKFDVIVNFASELAVEKIKKAGGSIVVLEKKAEKVVVSSDSEESEE